MVSTGYRRAIAARVHFVGNGRLLALMCVGAFALSACTAATSPSPTPSEAVSPGQSITSTPTTDAESVDWQLWIQGASQVEVATALTKEAVVLQKFADTDAAVVLDIVQPDSTWTLTLAPGDNNQEPVFAGSWPVLAESNDASGAFAIRAHHPGGVVRELYSSTGQGAVWISYTAVGDTLYYAEVADDRQCLDSVVFTDDEVGAAHREWCPDAGTAVNRLWANGEHSISFLTQQNGDTCSRIYVHSGSGTREVQLPDGSCPDIAVATPDLALWTEAPPIDENGAADWTRTAVVALVNGERTDLGIALGGAITICDGAAVWLTSPPATESNVDEVHRWRPGDQKPTLIYSGELLANGYQASTTASPECVDGIVAIQRRGEDIGVQVLTERPMGWSIAP